MFFASNPMIFGISENRAGQIQLLRRLVVGFLLEERIMEIVEKKVSELKAYENNPRKNDNAVEAVANSIREFGFKVPIVIDSNDVIVCGHTRLKAAIQLGMETVPCIVASDLTEEQIRAFRLADNKTNELAEWDFSALQMELSEILDIDMTDFGFIEPTDLDINDEDFYKNEKLKEKEKKKVVCPNCGKEFEL